MISRCAKYHRDNELRTSGACSSVLLHQWVSNRNAKLASQSVRTIEWNKKDRHNLQRNRWNCSKSRTKEIKTSSWTSIWQEDSAIGQHYRMLHQDLNLPGFTLLERCQRHDWWFHQYPHVEFTKQICLKRRHFFKQSISIHPCLLEVSSSTDWMSAHSLDFMVNTQNTSPAVRKCCSSIQYGRYTLVREVKSFSSPIKPNKGVPVNLNLSGNSSQTESTSLCIRKDIRNPTVTRKDTKISDSTRIWITSNYELWFLRLTERVSQPASCP